MSKSAIALLLAGWAAHRIVRHRIATSAMPERVTIGHDNGVYVITPEGVTRV